MSEFKVGDKAWISSVWTKGVAKNKVMSFLAEVVVDQVYEDGMTVVTDVEGGGMYIESKDLYITKLDALLDIVKGLDRWSKLDQEGESNAS